MSRYERAEVIPLKPFKEQLMNQLLERAAVMMAGPGQNPDPAPKRIKGRKHKDEPKDNRCVVCSRPGDRKRTNFICSGCPDKPHIHPKTCFLAYHTPGAVTTAVSPYSLDLHVLSESPVKLRVMWFVTQGELANIYKFRLILKSKKGSKLLDTKLNKNQRSITLKPLPSNSHFKIMVKVLDSDRNVLTEAEVPANTSSTDDLPDPSDPAIILGANEIRAEQARLVWSLNNVNLSKIKNIRLQVQSGGPNGHVLLSKSLSSDTRTFYFPKLPPNSILHVTVEAIGSDDQSFLSSAVTLKTPSSGEFGLPVTSSPFAIIPNPISAAQALLITTSRSPMTTAMPTMTTTSSPSKTASIFTTTTPITTTKTPATTTTSITTTTPSTTTISSTTSTPITTTTTPITTTIPTTTTTRATTMTPSTTTTSATTTITLATTTTTPATTTTPTTTTTLPATTTTPFKTTTPTTTTTIPPTITSSTITFSPITTTLATTTTTPSTTTAPRLPRINWKIIKAPTRKYVTLYWSFEHLDIEDVDYVQIIIKGPNKAGRTVFKTKVPSDLSKKEIGVSPTGSYYFQLNVYLRDNVVILRAEKDKVNIRWGSSILQMTSTEKPKIPTEDPTKPIRVELHIVKATGRQTSLDIVWKIIPENIPMVLVKDTPINVTYYRVVNHKKDERHEVISAGGPNYYTIHGLVPQTLYQVRLQYAKDLPGRYYNAYHQYKGLFTAPISAG
ncbi:hypothetical protein RRG08_046984 [Elysia crispata]|uniref:Fibronectin type-III domain-containing protein n=1 Tax=Elysia crispata TaxID=231223 RepID=A0AAE1AA00_9GAST|nr:hypothetical protein RRG08_046984 [Elysia crispata]